MYLTVLAGAGTAFVFCSFWVYHYVHLDLDADGTGDFDSDGIEGAVAYAAVLTPFPEEGGGGEGPSSLKMDRRQTYT